MPNPLAKLEHISLQVNQRNILQDISLTLYAEQVLTLIGPNGAGKSSVLKVLLGLMRPDQGAVWRAPDLRIGYVPQSFHLDQLLPLTVERFLRLVKGVSRDQIHAALEETGVALLAGQAMQSLSGGEMQRVLLARAILRQPQLLVLDEPGQGMDVAGLGDLYRLITQLKERYRCGVLLVSHDLHLVMASTDHVLCLNTHECCSGLPEAVTRHPEYLRLFGDVPQVDELAVYTHHHNHEHDVHGAVQPLPEGQNCTAPGCPHRHE